MTSHSGLPPSIIVSVRDMARLEALLDSPALSRHPAAIALSQELERAQVLPPEEIPEGIVTMHSRVDCEDELNNETHSLTLVYPHEADFDKGRVSVLAPVGSALLGLAIGQTIDWTAPGGRQLRLRVTAVHYQPEAAGDIHR
ncbi:nucleoside diphosphate kinase regulator [Stenotrophomonas pictorum JCM 9942]|jgi:regulator of nucleoside diphosphate kinase|uniref:Nucleoside diphosphate kinase regulator n=1 Tax=Stenotrophomonas pictorum JCM 9942 TaxID=1236960 RepID=A0A0R0AIJ1_9GAMM|nr:nucleoside diphosphate kinase regulator [Stenotrophomonas pictorum]KRG41073.1 nucleoside diphosphate kinase regulator [Stenotrophomonas pictorum JCM 9942]